MQNIYIFLYYRKYPFFQKIYSIKNYNKSRWKWKKSKKYKNTKHIKKLYSYRKNYMNTYMHKVSKVVMEYAKTNKCGVIVIGDLKDIKQGMNYNKNFVQIPLHRLVQNIEYKAKLEGIKVEKISEKYT